MQTPLVPGQVGKSPTFGVRVPRETAAALDELAERQGQRRSELVRDALFAYLDAARKEATAS